MPVEFSFGRDPAPIPTPPQLRRIRLAVESTQAEVAAEMGVHRVRITLLEGQKSVTADVASRYLHAITVLKSRKGAC